MFLSPSLLSVSSAVILTLAANFVQAAPTTTTTTPKRDTHPYAPLSQSQNFNLVVNVSNPSIDFTPSIKNWVFSSYHVGAGEDYAVLEEDLALGSVLYVNGTAEDVYYHRSTFLTEGGSDPPFPFGVSIDAEDVTNSVGQHTVHINAGTGEAGIGLAQFPEPIPALTAPDFRGFYACNNTLPYGPAIQLLFKYYPESTPEGCVDVVLLPQCVVGGTVEVGANTVDCYADVGGIDWSYYEP